MAPAWEGRKWERTVRAAVRDACRTWRILAQAGPLPPEGLEAIIHRSAAPILRSMSAQPPELVGALVPTLVQVMLAAAIEAVAEEGRKPPRSTSARRHEPA